MPIFNMALVNVDVYVTVCLATCISLLRIALYHR